ncbi:SPOSA6832_04626 [Sporobolomyces salmonicolor]|uniref:SPOSA6832_04626-mRNA-1:cds n=1 Tax=Sporidiobolus salmonicolor TaxID=5005 RepID=A0A0D6ESN0_SPOSA|nr:SPOSA6832_04626 [Sporobolomyces salmonicolor]
MPPRPLPFAASSSSSQLKIHTAPEQSRLAPPPHASAGKPVAAPRFQVMTGRSKRDADVAGLGEDAEGDDAEEGDDDDDDDEDDDGGGGDGKGKGKAKARKVKHPNKRNSGSVGRRKISIEYIEDKPRRHVTFTKRKSGLMKKAFELSTLTGTDCLVVVVSESGLVYTFATPALKGVTEHQRGKNVLSAALRGELRIEPEGEGEGEGAEGDGSARPETGVPGAQGQLATGMLDPSLGGPGGSTSSSTGPAPPLATSTPFLPSATDTVSSFSFDNSSCSRSHPHATDGGGFEADLPVPPFDFQPHSSSAPTGQQHYPAYSLPPPASSPAPFFAPSASPSTAFPALPAPYPAQQHHPDHAPSYPPDLTPYARAAQSHARAFASYQAASQFARVPGYVLPSQRRLSSSSAAAASRDGEEAPAEGEREPKRAKYGAHDFADAAKEWAGRVQERAARDAGTNPSISSFLFAHSLSLHAASAVPFPVSSSSPLSHLSAGGLSTTGEPWRGYCRVPARSSSSAGATLGAFQEMCELAGVDEVPELEGAVEEFLTTWLREFSLCGVSCAVGNSESGWARADGRPDERDRSNSDAPRPAVAPDGQTAPHRVL